MNPKNYKILTFNDDSFSIDIRFDIENETIWMTQKEIASVFETSSANISALLKALISVIESNSSVIKFYLTTAQDGKQYNTKIYNLEIITLLSYKVRSKRAPTFISWANKTIKELKAKQEREINESYDNVLHSNKYEIVKFKDGDFEMDVNVSPKEETIWLTQVDIAKLFESTVKNISVHINNIFDSGELDFSTMKENYIVQSEGGRNVKRKVTFYNLDMVISVGYRVNSKRGIIFRRWASSIIKQFLIKQFSINNQITISQTDYIVLAKKVLEMDYDLSKLKKEFLKRPYQIFYKGAYFDAYSFISKIVASASSSITIIDPYMDINVLNYIKNNDKGISWILISSRKGKINLDDINVFEQQYFKINFLISDNFHDRFIIIDEKTVYHIGTSLNYIGNSVFMVFEIDDKEFCDEILKQLYI